MFDLNSYLKCIVKYITNLSFYACLVLCLLVLINGQSTNFSNKASTFKTKFIQSAKHCSSIYNISLAEITPLLSRDSDAASTQAMCFLFCMLQRYQVMDKSGDYHNDKLDNFLNSMPDSTFKTSLKSNKEKCLRESVQNSCQKAYKFSKCFYKNALAKKQGN